MRTAKVYFLLMVLIGGSGLVLYNYFSRNSYLNECNSRTGVVENIYLIESTLTRIHRATIEYDKKARPQAFGDRNKIRDLLPEKTKEIEWPILDTLETVAHFTKKSGDTVITYALNDTSMLKIKCGTLNSLSLVFTVNCAGKVFPFAPALRNFPDSVNKEAYPMITYFQNLLSIGDTICVLSSTDTLYHETHYNKKHGMEDYDFVNNGVNALCYDVEEIKNVSGESLYIFPYARETEEKVFKAVLFSIITFILAFIISLSLLFGWNEGK